MPADPTTPAGSPAPPRPAVAKVGDTITIDGANEGNRFVAVQWRITNTGVGSMDVGPTSGSAIIDADGQQFSPTYQHTTAGPLYPSTATIPTGSSRLGFVMYEVPSASKIQEIQFDPSMGLGSQIWQWIVS